MSVQKYHDWRLAAAVACMICAAPLDAETDSGASAATAVRFQAVNDAMQPIVVGSRDEVGKPSAGQKAVKGILGGILGGSGKRSGSKGPRTKRDPTRKLDFSDMERPETGLEAGARAKWTDDGLLISTRIDESEDKGTFQTLFLLDCAGRRLYPASLEIYRIWTEQSISVSWSKTTTSNGRVVNRESGGWSDTWSKDFGTQGSSEDIDGQVSVPAIWQQMGFDRAQGGVQGLGAYFRLQPEALRELGDVALIAHVTRPGQDPVVTEPANWIVSGSDPDRPQVIDPDQPVNRSDKPESSAWNQWNQNCQDRRAAGESAPSSGAPDEEQTAGTQAAGRAVATGEAAATAAGDHTTSAASAESAATPPCEEALVKVEEKKQSYLAKLDDPSARLQLAIQAAHQLGQATQANARAQANQAAEQAQLESFQSTLEAWDQWFEDKRQRLEQHRLEQYGSREPSWASGSRARAERRHNEQTAQLRQQVAEQQQKVAMAQASAANAAAALQAAQNQFDRALEGFRQALVALRSAKDEFAELAILHYRCSPCQVIANQWASVARLNDLLNRLKSLLGQASARTAAQLQQAQQQAAAAGQAANQAQQRLQALQNRRAAIEQELRDAVKTDDDCLSLEPHEGWGWVNLASMDRTRGTVVPEGAVQVHRSNFKGSDVRVYTAPGCLKERIENIDWNKVNELNSELADLQPQLAEADAEAIEAQRAAALAQASVTGLQAELDALTALLDALNNSGLEQNTDHVLQRLEELSEDCAGAMRAAAQAEAEANGRARRANDRRAAAEGKRDSLRRRARAAGDDLDDMDSSGGDEGDRRAHDDLRRRADDLGDGSGDSHIGPDAGPAEPAPDNLEGAERRRRAAEEAADDAEARADQAEDEADELEDAVDDLVDGVDTLGERLRAWRRYRAALAAYEDCLRKKQAAAEELARMDEANASSLQALAKLLGEAADGLSEFSDKTKELGRVNERAKKASKAAGDLSEKLERLANAMEVLDAILRADDLKPSEKLEAMAKAFDELREWLPELPGVSEMLEFYNEAMHAIAKALGEIEDRLSSAWADLVLAGAADPEDAPVGIRDEVRRLVKIRKLMQILARNCGKPPVPPQ